MSDESPPPPDTEFDKRLREAKAKRADTDAKRQGSAQGQSGLGFALRVASEMVAGLAIGVGLGLVLDWWLGTKPWLLIVFFFLGSAAGMLNVYRTVSGYGHAIGYKKALDEKSGPGSEK